MPITVRCDGCDQRFRVEDRHAGRQTKCPKCGQLLSIPMLLEIDTEAEALAGLGLFDQAEATKLETRHAPIEHQAPMPARLPPMAKEPWYYRALENYAKRIIWLCIAQFVIWSIITVVYFKQGGIGLLEPKEVVLYLVASFAVMLASPIATSPLFILVDIARNIRATKHFTAYLTGRGG